MMDAPKEAHTPPSGTSAMDRWLTYLSDRIDGYGVFKFLRSAEPLVLVVAMIALGIGLVEIHETRASRYWQLLITQAGRGVGQIEALEYLVRPRPRFLPRWVPFMTETSFDGITLAPESMVSREIGSDGTIDGSCSEISHFRAVELPHATMNAAVLICSDLERANLRGASLEGADLRFANLENAVLNRASLYGANLEGSNLDDAKLKRANLEGAVLRNADLERANLRRATLEFAVLLDADLQDAKLAHTNLRGADLRRAKDLQCSQLQAAKNWKEAIRDEEMACGAKIPQRNY